MPDLVDLVRDELARAAAEVAPSPALDARVHARLAAHTRRRRATVLAAAAAVVALALAVPMLASAGPDDGEQPGVVTDDGTSAPLYLVPDPLPPGYTLIDAGGDGRLAAPTSPIAATDAAAESAAGGTGADSDAGTGGSTDAGTDSGADGESANGSTGGSANGSTAAGGGTDAGTDSGADGVSVNDSTGGSASGSVDSGAGGESASALVGEGGVTARWAAFDPDGELTDVLTVSWGVGSEAGDPDGVLAIMEAPGATPVEVRGTDGWFDPATGVLAWAEPDGAVVVLDGGAPPDRDGVPQGVPMAADVAVGIADDLELLPSGEVVAPGIGDGWEAVGQWPADGVVGRAPRDAAWAGPNGAEVRMHLVTGDEVPPVANLHAAGSHRATVGGREAVVTTVAARDLPTVDGGSGVVEDADLVVVWEAEGDTQVTLSARRVAEADLLAFAASLRPASEQEWRALVDAADSGPTTTLAGTPTTSAPDAADDAPGPGGTASTVQPPAPLPADAPVQAAGTFTGHEEFRIGTGECVEVTHDLDATFSLDDGTTWELHVDYCGRHEGETWYGVGPFTLTVPGGDTITGTMDSMAPEGTDGEPYELVVTGGTGAYAGSTGSCQLDNHLSDRGLASQSHEGTFTCGITPGAG
jgi:hypothetical protein